jgi:phosphatidylserine decarboxylase
VESIHPGWPGNGLIHIKQARSGGSYKGDLSILITRPKGDALTTAAREAQFDILPAADDPHGGWLPRHGSAAMRTYVGRVLAADRTALAPSVQALATYIEHTDAVRRLASDACAANLDTTDRDTPQAGSVAGPRIGDVHALLHGLNTILTHAPGFVDGELIGLPFSAFLAEFGRTARGAALFRQPTVSLLVSNILNDWHAFLDSPASNVGFRVEGEQWLAPEVKERYRFPLWRKDAGRPPYWNSWNAFLARTFEHPGQERAPVRRDACWSGDWHCSPADLLVSSVPQQQALIDDYRLPDLFEGGRVLRTDVGPYDVHHWWAPVDGEVLFDPIAIPGCFIGRDHARGVIVIRTEDHGHVCCIPLGMSEVASIAFDPGMRRGARVRKGQAMGMFKGGGSSFALFFDKPPGSRTGV